MAPGAGSSWSTCRSVYWQSSWRFSFCPMIARRPGRENSIFLVSPCSPGLVLFLYGSDHLGERIGLTALLVSIVLLAAFYRMAIRKGDRALIDLQLFKRKTFSASAAT